MSIKLSPTAIIREAKRIKTTPSILATKSLKFKGKPDCERLVRFIKSSGEELSKVSIPNSKSLVKGMGGGKDGGLSDIASNDLLMNSLMAAMYPAQTLIGGGLGAIPLTAFGLGGISLGALGLGSAMIKKGPRNLLSKGINKTKKIATKVTSKISNAGKGVKNFFGKGGDEVIEGVAKKTAKKVGPKVAAKTAKTTTSKVMGALPLIGNLWDLGSAAYRFSKGDTVGGLLSLGSAIPIAGWGFAAIDIARDGGAFEGTPLKSKEEEEKEEIQEDRDIEKNTVKEKETDNKEKEKIDRVVDKFGNVVNKYSVKGKSLGAIPKIKNWFGFTEGGQVPGSGNRDTVPAMLTPGEVVMSKPAVDKIGADNLLAMNAAGGGTNRPSYDTLGYRFGQVNPDTIVSGSKIFTSKTTESTKKRGILSKIFDRDFESFKEKDLSRGGPGLSMQTIEKYKEGNLRGESILTEDIASVGVPDIMEHQEDLMRRINAVKGFEDKTIDDVIGGTVGMNAQQYTRLLNSSDAARATEKKREEARKLDEKENIDTSYRLLPEFQGGGLIQRLNGGGLVADTRTLGPNTPLPSPGWGRKGGFIPTPMWQKPLPSGGSGTWGTSIKLAKQNRPVGMVDDEVIIINTIPSQPTQQGGTPQMIPVPMGGGSQSQSSPPMPSYFQIVNSIRISSLLTKLSIT